MARAVISSTRRQLNAYHWRLMNALPGFALRVPPELSEEFAEAWPKNMHGWDSYIQKFNTTLHFRHEMAKSIR